MNFFESASNQPTKSKSQLMTKSELKTQIFKLKFQEGKVNFI